MKKIIHIDADCFFAAIELRRRPELKFRPVAVGGDPTSRGVVATCNYIARASGVRSAMASAQALRLCPDLVFIRPDMSHYKKVSQQMMAIFSEYSDRIQPLSLDEAYLDVSDSVDFSGSATLIAEAIQQRILTELDISVSVGVAPIKFLAKIASDWRKPAGIYTIAPADLEGFLNELSLNKLPGVGPSTWKKLNRLDLYTCRDVRSQSSVFLYKHFGRYGQRLYDMCYGIDHSDVEPSRIRRSLSVEHTFNNDLVKPSEFHQALLVLLERLQQRYVSAAITRPVCQRNVKLRFSDFSYTSVASSVSSLHATSDSLFTLMEYEKMLNIARQRCPLPARLVGVGVQFSDQETSEQLLLPLN